MMVSRWPGRAGAATGLLLLLIPGTVTAEEAAVPVRESGSLAFTPSIGLTLPPIATGEIAGEMQIGAQAGASLGWTFTQSPISVGLGFAYTQFSQTRGLSGFPSAHVGFADVEATGRFWLWASRLYLDVGAGWSVRGPIRRVKSAQPCQDGTQPVTCGIVRQDIPRDAGPIGNVGFGYAFPLTGQRAPDSTMLLLGAELRGRAMASGVMSTLAAVAGISL